MPGIALNIVIIDDDSVIRNALKILLWSNLKTAALDLRLYSSKDGVDGLGLIYVSNPEIIIIDTTLPKYSGREIIDYLISNDKFLNKQVIVLNDGKGKVENLPMNYKVINKRSAHFVSELITHVKQIMNTALIDYGFPKSNQRSLILIALLGNLIKFANWSDDLMYRISASKSLLVKAMYIPWFLFQLISSILYSLVLVLAPSIQDANIKQSKEDLRMFRVKAYPTLVTFFVAFLFLLMQVFLFAVGGIVIFNNIRIESIFAATGNIVSVDFSSAEFDSNQIQKVGATLSLKENKEVIQEEVLSYPNPILNDLESQNDSQVIITYSINKPSIKFNQRIPFENLKAIYEESSINKIKEDSIPDINIAEGKRKVMSNEDIQKRTLPSNTISYQLSPDNENWYYYGSELRWEITINGSESSNTIQEVNQFLKLYQSNVGGDNLYLKAFLISDGNTPISLQSLTVEREFSIISPVTDLVKQPDNISVSNDIVFIPSYLVSEVPASSSNPTQGSISETMVIPVPTLFSASNVDGKSVVLGKVLGTTITDSDLLKFKVRVYKTSSTNTSTYAENKGTLLGESSLARNARGEIFFIVEGSGSLGDYFTAELVFVTESGESLVSKLSNPIEG